MILISNRHMFFFCYTYIHIHIYIYIILNILIYVYTIHVCIILTIPVNILHTCHILPPSEIDLGLCLPVFAGSGGKYSFHRIG